jgi:hypothetical protein
VAVFDILPRTVRVGGATRVTVTEPLSERVFLLTVTETVPELEDVLLCMLVTVVVGLTVVVKENSLVPVGETDTRILRVGIRIVPEIVGEEDCVLLATSVLV